MLTSSAWKSLVRSLPLVMVLGAGGNMAYADSVKNAGFEAGLADWKIPPAFTERAQIETGKAHTGTSSLKIIGGTGSPYVVQSVPNIAPGGYYKLTAWACVLPDGAVAAVEAAVKLENYNAAGKNTSGQYGRIGLAPDGQWRQVTLEMQANADTTRSDVLLRVFGNAVVLFDDIKLELVGNAPDISVVNTLPVAISANTPKQLEHQLVFRQAWAGQTLPEVTATVRSLNGTFSRTLPTTLVRGETAHLFTAKYTIPALPDNDYAVDFGYSLNGQALRTQPEKPVYLFTAAQNRKPANLTSTGTILHNDKPFFPIGMYHPGNTEENYKLLAENGFNAIQGDPTTNIEAFGASLDLAQKYNLAVDVPLYNAGKVAGNLENSLEKIRRFANHPAVFTWKIIDEPDLRPEIVHEVPTVYRALKQADPKRPIELTMALDDGIAFWSNFSDIVQIDRYPVPGRPLTQVSDFTRHSLAQMQPWQNLTYVVQCGWVPDLSNQPSVAQARSMVYLALISGAKGIFWYSMYDPGWDLSKTPLWPHMKGINQEIKTLSEPVMLGTNVDGLSSDNAKVHFMAKKHQGKLYVLVTNPEEQAARANLSLPQNLTLQNGRSLDGRAVAIGNDRKIPLELNATDSRTLVFDIVGG
jgi:hypothetical protein